MSIQVKSIRTSPVLQSKSVLPKQKTFTISPDDGYDGFSSVTIYGNGYIFRQDRNQLNKDQIITTNYTSNQDAGTNFSKDFTINLQWDLSSAYNFTNSISLISINMFFNQYEYSNYFLSLSAHWSRHTLGGSTYLYGGGEFIKTNQTSTATNEHNKFYTYRKIIISNKILDMFLTLNFDGTYYQVLINAKDKWRFQTSVYYPDNS